MTLIELITEVTKQNIPITSIKWDKDKGLVFEISGFTKSDVAELYVSSGNYIVCETRYNTFDEITSFEDLARVAFNWYIDYKHRSPFENPDGNWKPHWIKFGWIKAKEKMITEYEVS